MSSLWYPLFAFKNICKQTSAEFPCEGSYPPVTPEQDCNRNRHYILFYVLLAPNDKPALSVLREKLMFFHSHFSASCRSLDACERKSRKQRGVCVREDDNKTNRGHACRVSVLDGERAGKWEHNPDYCQPFTHSHTTTQRLGEKQTHISEKEKKKSLQAIK